MAPGNLKKVLVLNAGSSSLKFKLFARSEDLNLSLESRGVAERIGDLKSALSFCDASGKQKNISSQLGDHQEALRTIFKELKLSASDLFAVGHRVTHGSDKIYKASRITPEVKKIIADTIPLAPLHNPVNLLGIESAEALLGSEVPQVAVFDTAFHHSIPPEAYLYAVPLKDTAERLSVRKYGYHGSSYAFLLNRAAEYFHKPKEQLNLIICHLGAGASMACIKLGKCVDTTMGMTPLEGLCMSTRSGDIDPGAVLFLVNKLGIRKTDQLLNKQSGLYGLVKVNGNLDGVVFSAGIGEHSSPVRERICEGLEGFGIELSPKRNLSTKEGEISPNRSRVKVLVIPTDEEQQIAMETVSVVTGLGDG
uniref:Probable acetate kinase n=1 Tax=Rhodosorus marinus TaxID=101924 RepID=A0A7S3ACW4_9RHOD